MQKVKICYNEDGKMCKVIKQPEDKYGLSDFVHMAVGFAKIAAFILGCAGIVWLLNFVGCTGL